MKKSFRAFLLSCVMGASLVLSGLDVSAATTIYDNKTGNEDGYDYELWKDNGTTSMTLNGGGKFSCSWSNINNALFRKGKKFDSTQTYQQIGNISVDYGCTYQPNGNSYLCVYGWTVDPLIEYYVVDSWGTWRPPGATAKGQITVDGGTYDVYQTTRVNQPSIKGNTTFDQYWSVRTSKRTSGTISVTEHFKAWEKLGMKCGKLYETALTVEGYQSSGKADVYKNNITIGGSTTNNSGNSGNNNQGNTGNNNPNNPSANTGSGSGSTTPAQSATGVSYTYKTMNDWGSGYQGEIVIKNNTNQTFNGWSASFDTASKIASLWGAVNAGKSGNTVTVKNNSWDANFAPGQSITIGFVAEGSSANQPTNFKFNNAAVNQGGSSSTGEQNQGSNTGNAGNIGTEQGNTGNTGNAGNEQGNTGNNSGSAGTEQSNTGNNGSTAVNTASTMQAENMTLSGTYAGKINSPFAGVALYANNDSASYTQSFGNSSHDFTLRGCSDGSKMARVDLKIAGENKGSFYFGDSYPAEYTLKNVTHKTGNVKIELVVTTDDGTWDAYIDYLKIDAAGTSTNSNDNSGNSNNNSGSNTGNNQGTTPANKPTANTKMVALTFDDGPSSTTTQVLDVLEKYNAKATFFLIGKQVNGNTKAIMQRQLNMGCELASHSYNHNDMGSMSAYQVQQEVNQTSQAIKNQVNYDVKFFRAPYLSTSQTMFNNINVPFIQGITADDWYGNVNASTRARNVLNNVSDGTIILLHDFQGNTQTVEALPTIIQGLQNQGYTLVTVSELFEYKGVNPNQKGKVWTNVYR